MPGGSDIFDDIVEKLDQNGDMSEKEFRRDVIHLLAELGRRTSAIDEIKKKVEGLERNSILLMAKKYPKYSLPAVAAAIVFTIFVADRLDLLPWIRDVIVELIGIPLP